MIEAINIYCDLGIICNFNIVIKEASDFPARGLQYNILHMLSIRISGNVWRAIRKGAFKDSTIHVSQLQFVFFVYFHSLDR